jgi:hypothetical protein
MFFKKENLVVIGQLLFILILALIFSTTTLSPLNNNGIEGFSSYSSLGYTGVSAPAVPKDDLTALNEFNKENVECKKVGGFSGYGVFCAPSSSPEQIDIFSQAKGDISCDGLGYFNSRGSLCLDENMKKMLSTRGANAVGGNGQIGSAV